MSNQKTRVIYGENNIDPQTIEAIHDLFRISIQEKRAATTLNRFFSANQSGSSTTQKFNIISNFTSQ
jgi:hypothetical protein